MGLNAIRLYEYVRSHAGDELNLPDDDAGAEADPLRRTRRITSVALHYAGMLSNAHGVRFTSHELLDAIRLIGDAHSGLRKQPPAAPDPYNGVDWVLYERDPRWRTRMQETYVHLPDHIKEDVAEACLWLRRALTQHEGEGHDIHLSVYVPGSDQMVCSFAKPEWPGDHSGPPAYEGAVAVVAAGVSYFVQIGAQRILDTLINK